MGSPIWKRKSRGVEKDGSFSREGGLPSDRQERLPACWQGRGRAITIAGKGNQLREFKRKIVVNRNRKGSAFSCNREGGGRAAGGKMRSKGLHQKEKYRQVGPW